VVGVGGPTEASSDVTVADSPPGPVVGSAVDSGWAVESGWEAVERSGEEEVVEEVDEHPTRKRTQTKATTDRGRCFECFHFHFPVYGGLYPVGHNRRVPWQQTQI